MNKYIEYLKDNPRGYWFKRKIYGWGWTPARWEGWAFILLWVALLVEFMRLTRRLATTPTEALALMIIPMAILIALLFLVSYGTGERPKWMWGLEENQNKRVLKQKPKKRRKK